MPPRAHDEDRPHRRRASSPTPMRGPGCERHRRRRALPAPRRPRPCAPGSVTRERAQHGDRVAERQPMSATRRPASRSSVEVPRRHHPQHPAGAAVPAPGSRPGGRGWDRARPPPAATPSREMRNATDVGTGDTRPPARCGPVRPPPARSGRPSPCGPPATTGPRSPRPGAAGWRPPRQHLAHAAVRIRERCHQHRAACAVTARDQRAAQVDPDAAHVEVARPRTGRRGLELASSPRTSSPSRSRRARRWRRARPGRGLPPPRRSSSLAPPGSGSRAPVDGELDRAMLAAPGAASRRSGPAIARRGHRVEHVAGPPVRSTSAEPVGADRHREVGQPQPRGT